MSDDDDVSLEELEHVSPGYKRALWVVMLLNVTYGVTEMLGGFIADSQGVKADALDFIGDGTITLLGLLAISWGLAWRARAALLQGLFLALLAAGVMANAVYRVFVTNTPEADLMTLLGFAALVVNLSSTAILMKYRTGDANIRAVWLFSRNDALGNVAIIIAAAFVWATSTPWPDLIVAVIVAGLFLHSAWEIIERARADLLRAASAT